MFVDIDGDGDLDIWSPGQNALWIENQGGTNYYNATTANLNTRTTMPGGVGSTADGEGATAADVNNDGYIDFIFSNSTTDNEIYLNNGDYTYTREPDINGGGGITGLPDGGAGVADHENMEWAWGDYDNDGDNDVYISGADNEGLYRNGGTGAFTDVTVAAGITITDPDGATWGDYDNDGNLDLLVAQQGGSSHLYRNLGDGTFSEVASAANIGGTGDIGKTVGFFDSDNDGDLDILSNDPPKLWRNDLDNNNYLKVMAFGNGTVGWPGSRDGSATIDAPNISSNSFSVDPVTLSHTVAAGRNAFLMVGISVESAGNVTDVTWGATTLTKVREDVNPSICRSEIWYAALGSLDSDTTNTLTVDLLAADKSVICVPIGVIAEPLPDIAGLIATTE